MYAIQLVLAFLRWQTYFSAIDMSIWTLIDQVIYQNGYRCIWWIKVVYHTKTPYKCENGYYQLSYSTLGDDTDIPERHRGNTDRSELQT